MEAQLTIAGPEWRLDIPGIAVLGCDRAAMPVEFCHDDLCSPRF
ncbi:MULTISPECIES: hypothetical protein [Cyanophyceae]|nr:MULTISPECIES: hypothetical protein [Cyanophyceae]